MKKIYTLLIALVGCVSLLFAQKDSTHFVFTIQTDTSDIGFTNDSSFIINLDSRYLYDFDVDWDNDGIFDTTNIKYHGISHQYDSAGQYTIRIRGIFPKFSVSSGRIDDREKLISIDQWGTIEWRSFHRSFTNCINLNINATDTPDLDSVIDMSYAFFKISSFNESIENWDVSAVQNMSHLFRETSFNRDLGNWDVNAVTDMSAMFWDTPFNQNIGNWNTSKVENMWAMFFRATSFNQDIGNWNVSNVIDMGGMFGRAEAFNQDIGNWDVSKVKYLFGIFQSATAFNQDIGDWKVDSVELISSAFQDAISFNQDLSKWNVSKVRDMSRMFSGAKSFNQDLGSWNINSIDEYNSLRWLFDSSGLSMENYDNTLIEWQAKPHPDSVAIDAWGMKYCLADSARNLLINDGWKFTGDSLANNCITSLKETQSQSTKMDVYPNPTTGLLNIDLPKNQTLTSIFDSNGRLIRQFNLNQGKHQIDLSEYPDGLYFIRTEKEARKVLLNNP